MKDGLAQDATWPRSPRWRRRVRPRSRYARGARKRVPLARRGERMRELYDQSIPGRQHRGLRFNLQYGVPMTNPQLASAWRRELNHAAAHADIDYPDPQGVLALRTQVCDYLARRRGVITAPEDVLIVSGTQQAFALAPMSCSTKAIACCWKIRTTAVRDRRCRRSARGRRRSRRCRRLWLPTSCRKPQEMRLAVVTPSHQFPTGAVLSSVAAHAIDRAGRKAANAG